MGRKPVFNKEFVTGRGVAEENSFFVGSEISGQFYIGAYAFLHKSSSATNFTLGRFSRIESGVEIGMRKADPKLFSNHFFAYSENGPFRNNEGFQGFKSKRYFYEKGKQVLIGNDVLIQSGSKVLEGVSIGDGAIVEHCSYVVTDVPAYAIVRGNPALVVGYRFPLEIINRIKLSAWWKYDLSRFLNVDKENLRDVDTILDRIEEMNGLIKYAEYKVYSINSALDEFCLIDIKRVILGPSHIDRWVRKIDRGELVNTGFVLYGLHGMSLYSEQAKSISKYWMDMGYTVVIFVPDFRIGNLNLSDSNKNDARFIEKSLITDAVDRELASKSIEVLDEYTKISNGSRGSIRFMFWCLYAREELNKASGRYVVNEEYYHPTWNADYYFLKYSKFSISLDQKNLNIPDMIEKDGSVHPTNLGYQLLSKLI